MKTQAIVLALFAGLLADLFLVHGKEWYCTRVEGQDCSTFDDHFVCGTNNVTYKNMCFFAKAHCQDASVVHRYEGPCGLNGPNTTRSPEEVAHGSEVALDFECIYLSHVTCPQTADEVVCATDGYTYPNFCEYEKAKCMHRDLHVANFGNCTSP